MKWKVVHETDREELCMAMEDMIPDVMSMERDAHLPNLANLIVANGGGQIIGPAGVGKTFSWTSFVRWFGHSFPRT